MTKDTELRILRIGIIQGGKIIEERLIKKRDTVTIGQSVNATFSIPLSELPKEYQLFVMKGGQYSLSFTDAMVGSVTVKDGSLDLNSIKAQHLSKRTGDSYQYPLMSDSRGKVVIGDVTILFQFVIPPPEPPKPQLPELARGYWLKNLDKPYLTILGLTFLLHFGLVIGVQSAPLPKEPTFEEIPNRILKMIIPEKLVEETKKNDEGTGDEKDIEDVKEVKTAKQTSKGGDSASKGAGKPTAAEVKNKVMGTGILKVIGSIGTGNDGGALADVLKGGGASTKLGDALTGIGTIGVATNEGMATRLGGGGSGGGEGAVGIGDLGTQAGTGPVGAGNVGGEKKEAKVSGSMSVEQFDAQGSPDCGKYGTVVKARSRVVQNCYLSELQKNPNLGGGKVTVEISVDENGSVSEVRVVSNTMSGTASVADCITSRIRNWKFPKPEKSCSFSQTFVLTKS
jgi:hypothetical protein